MNNDKSIQIYEVLYSKGQRPTSKDVIPLAIDNSNPEWRELQAYMDIYSQGYWKNSSFTGVFSPKFNLKVKISLSEFLRFVKDNIKSDVCFINPFPQMSYWSFNVWMQGEYAHPGLTKSTQDLLNAVGIPWDISKVPRHDSRVLSYSNFWVASPHIWDAYVGGILKPIAQFLSSEPDHPASKQALKSTSHTKPAPYLPFIIERLFSTFLTMDQEVSFSSYPFDMKDIVQKYCINEFEQLLVRGMEKEINFSDGEKKYSSDLIMKMNLLTSLHQQHHFDYYKSHKHPHTGQLMEGC